MRVFLDTNVLVDYLNKREPFFADAAQVIDICGRETSSASCLHFQ